MSYEILEHTADEKFRAEGDSLEEAFSESVKAFSEIVKGSNGQEHHKIDLESENLHTLLFDFLDRLIFLQDTEGIVVSNASEMSIEERENSYKLEAEIETDVITNGMSLTDVKAPTYNEMKVDYEDGKWVLEAVLDI